jgi:hypothetical protein
VPFDGQSVAANFGPVRPPPPGFLDYEDFPAFEAVPPNLRIVRGQRYT